MSTRYLTFKCETDLYKYSTDLRYLLMHMNAQAHMHTNTRVIYMYLCIYVYLCRLHLFI